MLDQEILNAGLDLAMEWGENWLQPIQDRLAKKYPRLSKTQLDEYNATCQAAMKFGHDYVYELVTQQGADRVSSEEFERIMLAQYSWVSSGNLSRLFSQGMYYAMK